jgi:hypothetical protein
VLDGALQMVEALIPATHAVELLAWTPCRAERLIMYSRMQIFEKAQDYAACERILDETLKTRPMRVCSYGLLPNHWHFVRWPEHDGDLAAFLPR